jgi:hypothetical protein
MKKKEICHRNLKRKNLKIFIFETEMKISVWNLKKKLATLSEGNEKNWNEEIIYFVYATEIKLPIIPLYHLYHMCKLWWYTINLNSHILSILLRKSWRVRDSWKKILRSSYGHIRKNLCALGHGDPCAGKVVVLPFSVCMQP